MAEPASIQLKKFAPCPASGGLLGCGFAGTYTGRHLLHRLPERAFRLGLKAILTAIALRLLYGAARAWPG